MTRFGSPTVNFAAMRNVATPSQLFDPRVRLSVDFLSIGARLTVLPRDRGLD
jgi:hypothetical protein